MQFIGIAVIAVIAVVTAFAVLLPPVNLLAAPVPEPTATVATDDVRATFEVLRSDFNATKIRTLNRVGLTTVEAEIFRPIYRDYAEEMGKVADRKLALIREFAAQHKAGSKLALIRSPAKGGLVRLRAGLRFPRRTLDRLNAGDQSVRSLKGNLRLRKVTRRTDNGHRTPTFTARTDLPGAQVPYRKFAPCR